MFELNNRIQIHKFNKGIEDSWVIACEYYKEEKDYPLPKIREEYERVINLANAITTMANRWDDEEYPQVLQDTAVKALELAEQGFEYFVHNLWVNMFFPTE